ncbi:prepilin-type N-terminal cleavage/methylation domain-containing protein [Oscillibacter valericigenes]|nr:prepilin-type N-terminal cleavage/methylation domain-containing protein [Oscillibacter valericigenes]
MKALKNKKGFTLMEMLIVVPSSPCWSPSPSRSTTTGCTRPGSRRTGRM